MKPSVKQMSQPLIFPGIGRGVSLNEPVLAIWLGLELTVLLA